MTINVSQFKAIWTWLAEVRNIWIFLGTVLMVIGFFWAISPCMAEADTIEPYILWAGLILQVLGICLAMYGIAKTRDPFGLKQYKKIAEDWLRRFPLLPKRLPTVILAIDPLTQSSVIAHISLDVDSKVSPTIEACVESIRLLKMRDCQLQQEINALSMKMGGTLESEKQSRQKGHNEIQEKLKETSTEGAHFAMIGTAWLLVGAIISTAAPEIAKKLSNDVHLIQPTYVLPLPKPGLLLT